MKKIAFYFVLLVLLVSCGGSKGFSKGDIVPYEVANNYFVNNSVDKLPDVKIESQDDFQKYFGMATAMGPNGKPTAIDFNKQYVIAVVRDESWYGDEIKPGKLKWADKGLLEFSYKILKDKAKRSYSVRPLLLIVVDRKYDADVQLKAE